MIFLFIIIIIMSINQQVPIKEEIPDEVKETEKSEMMTIDFITTACNRPELLDRTLESFTKNLKNIDYSTSILYINVDPAPTDENIGQIKEVCRKYFKQVALNQTTEPNFAKAVQWCTSKPKREFVFYLEDDWTLSKEVNIHDLIKIMKSDDNIKEVQLRKMDKHLNIEENTHVFGFPPGLWRSDFLNDFSKIIKTDINPELQMIQYQRELRNKKIMVCKKIYADVPIIHDLGRWWLKKNKLERDYGNKEKKWTPWIKWKKQ